MTGSAGTPQVIGASVRGASHRRTGRPNQDAVAWLPASGAGERVIAAVADGHGSPRSFRSDEGARRAVEVATKVLWSGFSDHARLDQAAAQEVLRAAVDAIVARWRAAVTGHLDQTPFSDNELAALATQVGPQAVRDVRSNPWLAYGTTLLAAAVTSSWTCYAQLGDGDILAVSVGDDVRHPLPPDRRLVADETTSLCDARAATNFRTLVEPRDGGPRLVLLSSDGYSNSFAGDVEFQQVGPDLRRMIDTDGTDAVGARLEGWLSETSDEGAGDDVTLALIVLPVREEAPATPVLRPVPPAPAPFEPPQETMAVPRLVVRLGTEPRDVTAWMGATIGRGPNVDLRTGNPRVSGLHARLVVERGRWVLVDAGSANGLYHNRARVTRLTITEPTTVWLGDPVNGARLDLLLDAREPAVIRTSPAPGSPRRPDAALRRRSTAVATAGIALAFVLLLLLGVNLLRGGVPDCGPDPDSWVGETVEMQADGAARRTIGELLTPDPLGASAADEAADVAGVETIVINDDGEHYVFVAEDAVDSTTDSCRVPGDATLRAAA